MKTSLFELLQLLLKKWIPPPSKSALEPYPDVADGWRNCYTTFMNNTPKLPTKLPTKFYSFFWDVDAKKINPATHPHYVINRLLDKGELEAVRWVVKTFSKDFIVDSLIQDSNISPITATFFANYFSISPDRFISLRKKKRLRRISTGMWRYA